MDEIMQKYISKQVRILRPAERVYEVLSDFNNLTPALKDRVDGWSATEKSCLFRIKGIPVMLEIVDRQPYSMIKIASSGHSPVAFTLWLQLQEVSADDTRMRLVLHLEMSMMVKMVAGSKIQSGLDSIADNLAAGFNSYL